MGAKTLSDRVNEVRIANREVRGLTRALAETTKAQAVLESVVPDEPELIDLVESVRQRLMEKEREALQVIGSDLR